jgi:hypothetical protein
MGVGQAAVDKVSKGLRKSFQFLFGHAPTGRGTIFISRNKFLSSRGRELAAGPADEQLFTRQNFLCPAMGLSYSDMTLLALALLLPLGPKTYVDSRQRPTTANVTVNTGSWSVFVTPLGGRPAALCFAER